MTKQIIIQIRNPKTDRYIKINKTLGKIISYKKTKGPYAKINIVGNKQ